MTLSVNIQKGGVGKSTISWNLAIELSKIKGKTLEVVDLDVQQTLTMNNYVRKSVGLKPLNVRTFKDIDLFKEYLKTDSDDKIILCDTGAYDSSLNRFSALVADYVITPLSNSSVDLQGLKAYEEIIKDLNSTLPEESKIKPYVIMSLIDPRTKKLAKVKKYIESTGSFNVLDSIVSRRPDFINSITNGKSVREYSKDSKADTEISNLIKEIRKIMAI